MAGGQMRSGNSRENKVRRWIDALKSEVIAIRLDVMTQRDDRDVLEAVTLARVSRQGMGADAISVQLCELLQDAADESGRPIKGAIVGENADGDAVARMPVQCRANKDPEEELGSREELDGTTRGERQQDQRHREAMTRLRIMEVQELRNGYDSVISHLMEHNERLASRLESSEAREDESRALVRAIEDEVARQAAEQSEDGEDGDASTRMLLQVLTPVFMRLASNNVAKKPASDHSPDSSTESPSGDGE